MEFSTCEGESGAVLRVLATGRVLLNVWRRKLGMKITLISRFTNARLKELIEDQTRCVKYKGQKEREILVSTLVGSQLFPLLIELLTSGFASGRYHFNWCYNMLCTVRLINFAGSFLAPLCCPFQKLIIRPTLLLQSLLLQNFLAFVRCLRTNVFYVHLSRCTLWGRSPVVASR
jgi:hypothetical protein